MDIREQQEATLLSTALRGGQEQQAHDYLLNVVLQEPHALQIIKSANEQAGAQRLDSVGVYQPSGRVVLVPSTETGRQTEVGRLSPQQLGVRRESDARGVRTASSGGSGSAASFGRGCFGVRLQDR